MSPSCYPRSSTPCKPVTGLPSSSRCSTDEDAIVVQPDLADSPAHASCSRPALPPLRRANAAAVLRVVRRYEMSLMDLRHELEDDYLLTRPEIAVAITDALDLVYIDLEVHPDGAAWVFALTDAALA